MSFAQDLTTTESATTESATDKWVTIPQGIVYRSFVKETVILNLETGQYHGVNPTGGRMLETLDKLGSLSEAAKSLASEYGISVADIKRDLSEFCDALAERGLLQIREA